MATLSLAARRLTSGCPSMVVSRLPSCWSRRGRERGREKGLLRKQEAWRTAGREHERWGFEGRVGVQAVRGCGDQRDL
ncbi:unnamed protein product [Gulo gulo]|uniref:Uncharacterized protein n=1 Tax=Gulo gulo TaxID=48420 RepID=A0A9X9PZY5_GULGU|nr:unnamed protein product [Gulo gulo]